MGDHLYLMFNVCLCFSFQVIYIVISITSIKCTLKTILHEARYKFHKRRYISYVYFCVDICSLLFDVIHTNELQVI